MTKKKKDKLNKQDPPYLVRIQRHLLPHFRSSSSNQTLIQTNAKMGIGKEINFPDRSKQKTAKNGESSHGNSITNPRADADGGSKRWQETGSRVELTGCHQSF